MNADFEKNLKKLKDVIEIIISKLKLAETRRDVAEKALEDFKNKNQEELKKAYNLGYQKGRESLSTDVQGGRTKENNPKTLVYKNNN